MSKSIHPTVEIMSFTASEALLSDESLLNPVLDTIRKGKGVQHIYVGKCFDDGETNLRFIFVVWDTYEDHKRLMDDETTRSQVITDFTKCVGGEATMHNVVSSDDVTMVFSAPVTEIAQVQVKGQLGTPVLKKLFMDWAEAAHEAPLAKEYQPFVFGQTLEKANIYYMLGGWISKDHHLNCIATELKPEIGQLVEQTEHLKVNHCTVREYGFGGQW